jgi:hypothetical protein
MNVENSKQIFKKYLEQGEWRRDKIQTKSTGVFNDRLIDKTSILKEDFQHIVELWCTLQELNQSITPDVSLLKMAISEHFEPLNESYERVSSYAEDHEDEPLVPDAKERFWAKVKYKNLTTEDLQTIARYYYRNGGLDTRQDEEVIQKAFQEFAITFTQ